MRRMRLFWWTQKFKIWGYGRQLQSYISLSIQFISVFGFGCTVSWKSWFTQISSCKWQQFFNSSPCNLRILFNCMLAQKLERGVVGDFCFKVESLTISINCSHSLIRKCSIWRESMNGFLSQFKSSLFGGKCSSNVFCNIMRYSTVIFKNLR